MSKKATNDQGEIIKALQEKKFNVAWEKVKYVGYNIEPNINNRYIIFQRACKDFDCSQNNNFILFYRNYINYMKLDKNNNYMFSETSSVIKQLKNEEISPSNNASKLVKQIKKIGI